jgi:hypothetical protein
MGRPKTQTPKSRVLNVRLDEADGAVFDELLRRRREALKASEDEYTPSMFVRSVFRKLGEEAGIVAASAGAAQARKGKAKR